MLMRPVVWIIATLVTVALAIWLHQRRLLRKVLLSAVALLFAVGLLEIIYVRCCATPARAAREFISRVPAAEERHVAKFGRFGSLGELSKEEASIHHRWRAVLKDYEVEVRLDNAKGYEIVVRPRSWSFCRPSYALDRSGVIMTLK